MATSFDFRTAINSDSSITNIEYMTFNTLSNTANNQGKYFEIVTDKEGNLYRARNFVDRIKVLEERIARFNRQILRTLTGVPEYKDPPLTRNVQSVASVGLPSGWQYTDAGGGQ